MKKSNFVERALLNWRWWVVLPYVLFMIPVVIVFIFPFYAIGSLFKWAGKGLLRLKDWLDSLISDVSRIDKVRKWVDTGWKKM